MITFVLKSRCYDYQGDPCKKNGDVGLFSSHLHIDNKLTKVSGSVDPNKYLSIFFIPF